MFGHFAVYTITKFCSVCVVSSTVQDVDFLKEKTDFILKELSRVKITQYVEMGLDEGFVTRRSGITSLLKV